MPYRHLEDDMPNDISSKESATIIAQIVGDSRGRKVEEPRDRPGDGVP